MTDLFTPPGATPAPQGPTDQSLAFDSLCIHQAPAGVQHLAELLSPQRTARGTPFSPQELRKHLVALQAVGLVSADSRGRWSAEPGAAWTRFVALMLNPGSRATWWNAWRQAKQFEQHWRSLNLSDEDMVDALRMVVHAAGTVQALDRLASLSFGSPPEHPRMLARALLMPFDLALWERIEPELQYRLLTGLMQLTGGDNESTTAPLWAWLLSQSRPRPEAMHDLPRLNLAQRMVFADQPDETQRLLRGMDDAVAKAVLATTDIAAGRFAEGAVAFEAAAKRRGTDTGRRKALFSDHTAWCYLLALIAQPDPAAWTKARKFAANEAGKRDADPYSFFGIWQVALDQRLGDTPRNVRAFHLAAQPGYRMHGLHCLSHLLLAAWLGFNAPVPAALSTHAKALSDAYEASGQTWLALLVRRSAALLLDQTPSAADAAKPFAIGAAQDRWREALSAIVALGALGGPVAAKAKVSQAERLVWLVSATPQGRLRSIEPKEQKAGVRGLGKPKNVSLANLAKRTDLPAYDAAMLRAIKKSRYQLDLYLDPALALPALVRHPHVAWSDEPGQFIEVVESLPQLEVLTRGEHLQFRVVDPIRAEDAGPAQVDEDVDDIDDGFGIDDEDDEFEYRAAIRMLRRTALAQSRLRPIAQMASSVPMLLLRDGPERARFIRITPAQLRVAELVTQGWQVPTSARTELEAALQVLGSHFALASDAEVGSEIPPATQLRAELTPQGQGLALRVVAAPFGDFGPRLGPGQGRERVTTVHLGLTMSTRRALDLERAQLRALTDDVDTLDDGEHAWSLDEPEQALAVVEALARHGQAIISEWPKGKPMRISSVNAASVSLSVTSRGDWLEIDGELTVDDGQVLQLRQLLQLMQGSRSRYVALGDGGFLALTDTLRQQLADLRAITHDHGKVQRIASTAALAWAAQEGAPELGGDDAWQDRCAAWDNAQSATFTLPAGLQAELRDYQASGWRWLMRLAGSGFGAVLADDMGLGKTLQTLGLLIARAADGPALVVAPTSVCGNWLEEAARFAPGLRFVQYGQGLSGQGLSSQEIGVDSDADEGSDTELAAEGETTVDASPTATARKAARRRQVQALGAGDVLVCSYGLLQLDGDILAGRHWHNAVLDEAQAIKNAATRRARAAFALTADFRLALTGTPVENRLGELWSIFAFANPGLLGSADQFSQRFAGPIERDGDPQASRRLRRLIAPFLLRRTKTEVLSDLPPRTEIVHSVVPGSRERALLEALRQQAEDSVNQVITGDAAAGGSAASAGQSQMHILAALTRLRRAACDPRLVAPELGIVGAKVQEFERLAQELVAGHHKALVFSQFTDFLALLRERLDAAGLSYQYLDGSTPAAQRTQRVAAFQSGQGDFFLISLKAGGFGLNLTMADYVIIADPWWNPAAEDQASGRAHRIGQQRPVTVYRLVTQGSIEDRIVKLHGSKRALAEGVLAGQDGATVVMDAKQMLALLRGEDQA